MRKSCYSSGHAWRLRHRDALDGCVYWLLCLRCGDVRHNVYLYEDEAKIAEQLRDEGNYVSVGHCIEDIVRDHLRREKARLDAEAGK